MNYGYGGLYCLDNDIDGSLEILERFEDFLGNYKYQLWMDKIIGGIFKRDYLDRILFRVRLYKYVFKLC